MLWAQLSKDEQAALSLAHRQQYHGLTSFLYYEYAENLRGARAIAWLELSNILHAAHAALDEREAGAVDFANCVNMFLNVFGLKQESAGLLAKAEALGNEVGSRPWYLAQSARESNCTRRAAWPMRPRCSVRC